MDVRAFRKTVLDHRRRHGRHDLPWRKTRDPYAILVSEVMLQQTQVSRVIPFYRAFLKEFPTFRALALAKAGTVLKVWQGLGYNRRALMLQRCAQTVMDADGGRLPEDYATLRALPGLGRYTAGAVLVFALNRPYPLIETNIRRVYLHHFFPGRRNIPDSKILPLVISNLSLGISPRTWFGALMDYGAHLGERSKKSESQMANPNRRSKHYVRQPKFEGSDRQVRGAVVRAVLSRKSVTKTSLAAEFDISNSRLERIISGLEKDGLIIRKGERIRCA